MDFRFTEDEREIIGMAANSLQANLPAARLKEKSPSLQAWRSLGDEGWTHAGLPEELGGDLSLAMLAALGREAGRVLAGDTFVDNSVILPRLIGASNGPVEDSLEDLIKEPGFLCTPLEDDREKSFGFGVETGLPAYRYLGTAIERYLPGTWAFEPVGGLGVASGVVSFSGVPEKTFDVSSDTEKIWRDASIVHAAALIGAGEAAMYEVLEYAKTRQQFGKVIGSFQAVKHMLAETYVDLEIAWNAVSFAALLPDSETAAIAQLQADRASDHAGRVMVQLFGGIAMTWEHHAHWYLKTIAESRRRFGTSAEHSLKVAESYMSGAIN